ncbi:uncharacterized protein LOC142827860 isoform X1 [Pelodiscus sinensis]|uniref:uncharacterized protein LOC142827860 isoform X1 n=1 Tax=Pelodiscus sinensis TaxID=13735 RepID=UPI003F6AFB9E
MEEEVEEEEDNGQESQEPGGSVALTQDPQGVTAAMSPVSSEAREVSTCECHHYTLMRGKEGGRGRPRNAPVGLADHEARSNLCMCLATLGTWPQLAATQGPWPVTHTCVCMKAHDMLLTPERDPARCPPSTSSLYAEAGHISPPPPPSHYIYRQSPGYMDPTYIGSLLTNGVRQPCTSCFPPADQGDAKVAPPPPQRTRETRSAFSQQTPQLENKGLREVRCGRIKLSCILEHWVHEDLQLWWKSWWELLAQSHAICYHLQTLVQRLVLPAAPAPAVAPSIAPPPTPAPPPTSSSPPLHPLHPPYPLPPWDAEALAPTVLGDRWTSKTPNPELLLPLPAPSS